MSYSVDVNLLLDAADEASAFHRRARAFLDECVARSDLFCIPYLTLMAFLRMSTHPRIFSTPLTPGNAMANVRALASLPQVRLIAERDRFLDVYEDVTKDVIVRANLVPDAHLASILAQHGVTTLYTRDVDDFEKLGLPDVRNPLAIS